MGATSTGRTRTNDTHASTTDPDARLYRKSNNTEARLAYLGHLLIENRHGLIVDAQATVADGFAEREAAMLMLHTRWRLAPRGAARSAPTRPMTPPDFVEVLREIEMTPHVAQNETRRGGSAIDARTDATRRATRRVNMRGPGSSRRLAGSRRSPGLRKVKLRGLAKVDWLFRFASAAFNLRRLVTLRAVPA